MLVLSRLPDENIIISDKDGNRLIQICVVKVREGKVSIGISAPKEWNIDREEVYVRRFSDGKSKP